MILSLDAEKISSQISRIHVKPPQYCRNMAPLPCKVNNEQAVSQVYSNSRYCEETLKPRSNIWIWQMFVFFSSLFSPSNSSHTAVCHCTSWSASMLWDICTSLPVSFFSFSSFLCIHTHRTFFLMTDGKSTIVQHQSLKKHTHAHTHTRAHTLTHTHRMHTQTNTTSLSSCPFVPNPLSDVLICFLQLSVCITVCVCPSLPWYIKHQFNESLVRCRPQPVDHMGDI